MAADFLPLGYRCQHGFEHGSRVLALVAFHRVSVAGFFSRSSHWSKSVAAKKVCARGGSYRVVVYCEARVCALWLVGWRDVCFALQNV